MSNWKEVTERWLPIVEHMEEHDMDDYAIPEIYRAAEKEIAELIEVMAMAVPGAGIKPYINPLSDEWQQLVCFIIRNHKGD